VSKYQDETCSVLYQESILSVHVGNSLKCLLCGVYEREGVGMRLCMGECWNEAMYGRVLE